MVLRTHRPSAFIWLPLVACVVAACGTTPQAAAPTAPVASAATTAAAPTTAPDAAATADTTVESTAAAATNEPRTLTVWAEGSVATSMESDPTGAGKYGLYLKQTFEKEHPGVTVTIEYHGWDEELRQNLTNALLAGNPPDIVVGEGFFQNYAQLDALLPLDDVIADVKDNVVPGTIKGATYQGKVYGLPGFTGVFAFERNCAVVKEAGLDCSKAPATWDELTKQATEITQKGGGKYYGYTLQGPGGFSQGAVFRVAVLLNQAGATLCENDCTTPKFNDPKAAPVYEFLRAINKQTPPGLTFNPDEAQIYTQLFKGVSAYQIAGSWHTTWAKQNGCADCQYSAVPLPSGGKPASVVVGNVLYAVLKQSKNPDIAKQFVKMLVRDDVQDLVFPSLGRLPSTRSALTKLRPAADPATQSFIDVLLTSPELNVLPQYTKNPQKIWTAYNDMLTKVLTTDEPIQTLLDEGQKAAAEAAK